MLYLNSVVTGVTPCQLVCISVEQNILAIQEPVVEDGTPCDNSNSPNAICVKGVCTVRSHAYIICMVAMLFYQIYSRWL